MKVDLREKQIRGIYNEYNYCRLYVRDFFKILVRVYYYYFRYHQVFFALKKLKKSVNFLKKNNIFYGEVYINNLFNRMEFVKSDLWFKYKRFLRKKNFKILVFDKSRFKSRSRSKSRYKYVDMLIKRNLKKVSKQSIEKDFIIRNLLVKHKSTFIKFSRFYGKALFYLFKRNALITIANKYNICDLKKLNYSQFKFLIRKKYGKIWNKIKYKKGFESKNTYKSRIAIMHFRSRVTNYIITITDLSYNVLFTCSAGMVSDTNNKKTKVTSAVCVPMFLKIINVLKEYKIRRIKFQLTGKFDKFFYNAFYFFRRKGFLVKSISVVERRPHHFGQRRKKIRRI